MSECLIDHCLRLGSRDNMSVIVVLLNPAMKPKPEHDAPQPAAAAASSSSSSSAAAGGAAASEASS